MRIFRDKWLDNLVASTKKEKADETSEGTIKKATDNGCENRNEELDKKFPFKRKDK